MTLPGHSATHFSSVTAYLSFDHRRLDAILADVRRMVDDGEVERADHAFGDFFEGLVRHIRIEEEIVFPLFEERVGPSGPVAVMRSEHVVIREALGRMREALGRGSAAAFQVGLVQLLGVLPDHDVKEERILYPAIDRALSHAERAALVGDLERAPNGVRSAG